MSANSDELCVKKCGRCGIRKSKDEFYADKSRPDGKQRQCKKCQNARKQNTEAHRALVRKWRVKNPNKANEANRKWRENNPEKLKLYEKKRICKRRGITIEEFDSILRSQGGKCAICGKDSPGKKNWVIDHNHTTNENRGLLCSQCNVGIGMFRENAEVLEKAKSYLGKWNVRSESGQYH